MDNFYKKLPEKIVKAVKKDMRKIMNELDDENIYAAALVTDSDCVTLYLAVNTLEYLAENSDPDSEDKWLTDEWGYSDGEGSALTKLSELLYEHDKAVSDDDDEREEQKQLFYESVVSALRQLKSENVFGERPNEVICFASISDDDDYEYLENWSAMQLNTPERLIEFLKRYG